MGDHFVLLVDRLLTESTLEAALESRNRIKQTIPPTEVDENSEFSSKDCGADLSPRKKVECRICQDEDWDSNMEAPCSCSGSLKYAHRRCVQRWCNEKGDTVCEICHQHFWPGYTAPPSIFRLRSIPMNFRRDVNNSRLITMVSTDESLLDQDEYAAATSSRSIMCCQLIALIIMILLVLQHALPIIVNHAGHYSFPLITLLLLRVAGIILPVYIIMKVVTGILRLRQNRNVNLSVPSSHEEASSAASP